MNHPTDTFLGFDPGGHRGFGAAVLAGSSLSTVTVSTVAEAVAWAVERCAATIPVAAGIDTLLHWCDGPSGWRPADRWLRKTYPKSAPSVASANSLYGAMAIGGMALALRLRERWSGIVLNETHPKLLVPALGGDRYADADAQAAIAWLADHAGLNTSWVGSGHELDALLSAWATREGIRAGWTDLVRDDSGLIFPVGKVSYLWSESLPMATEEDPAARPPAVGGKRTRSRRDRATTADGYINQHQQQVVRKTDIAGSDHGQRVYVLRCLVCDHEYGANGSNIQQRRCPKHDGGVAGLQYQNSSAGHVSH